MAPVHKLINCHFFSFPQLHTQPDHKQHKQQLGRRCTSVQGFLSISRCLVFQDRHWGLRLIRRCSQSWTDKWVIRPVGVEFCSALITCRPTLMCRIITVSFDATNWWCLLILFCYLLRFGLRWRRFPNFEPSPGCRSIIRRFRWRLAFSTSFRRILQRQHFQSI